LEEVHELIEAIDSRNPQEIVEELGDVLFQLIFIGKIGEKEKRFTLDEAIRHLNEKLIRRHPHIFDNVKIQTVDDILQNWEIIKKKEKERQSILDGIPSKLPIIARCQKVIEKLRRSKSSLLSEFPVQDMNDEELGKRLWELLAIAQKMELDAEGALRRYCNNIEIQFKNTGE
jgi:tetrapyrrole methylase family protein / MazG family protein